MMTREELDIDVTYGLDNIECLLASKNKFYVMSNKKD